MSVSGLTDYHKKGAMGHSLENERKVNLRCASGGFFKTYLKRLDIYYLQFAYERVSQSKIESQFS
jgi:hypothetical protein